MTLSEIFIALPVNVSGLLEKLLEGSVLPEDPTNEEVELAAKLLISLMKDEFPSETTETYELLDQVPTAVVEQLFQ